jgi:hypothetical protein
MIADESNATNTGKCYTILRMQNDRVQQQQEPFWKTHCWIVLFTICLQIKQSSRNIEYRFSADHVVVPIS